MHVLSATSCTAWIVGLAVATASSPAAASPFAIPPSLHAASEAPEPEPEPEPELAEAVAENQAGSDAYALGNYEQAVTHFERAYQLSHEPALLFNLGQAYTRWYDLSNALEHLEKARRLYENYVLNIGHADLDEAQEAQARVDAQRRIAEVDRLIAQHEQAFAPAPAPATTDEPAPEPVHKKAWFWVAVIGGVAVVVGGVTAGVLLANRDEPFEPELGTIGAGRRVGLSPGGWTLRF
ncbi:tetratricopeptide repeat protein [Pseudenhygromyxa sp. WMMC2535]|uniref:tetratricopeptide repeat protein n=1 Tax=Pseudenhygromyxa sp. WMMC2535 TaxID=2712867 RepID=UPI0015575DB3|nr:tetratricopeptide repeat protein [Pseudenhygromyxa sp. WMMC2535]NVB37737.1 tetratricopeptide repeat protein [Pseudenhygromyxa sp. WMMC2535]